MCVEYIKQDSSYQLSSPIYFVNEQRTEQVLVAASILMTDFVSKKIFEHAFLIIVN